MHIFKENVFENKTPEVYIWDCDKATKDMKPQVSCFKSITPLGDGESLVDLCTDCIYRHFYRNPFGVHKESLCTNRPSASVDNVRGVNI